MDTHVGRRIHIWVDVQTWVDGYKSGQMDINEGKMIHMFRKERNVSRWILMLQNDTCGQMDTHVGIWISCGLMDTHVVI